MDGRGSHRCLSVVGGGPPCVAVLVWHSLLLPLPAVDLSVVRRALLPSSSCLVGGGPCVPVLLLPPPAAWPVMHRALLPSSSCLVGGGPCVPALLLPPPDAWPVMHRALLPSSCLLPSLGRCSTVHACIPIPLLGRWCTVRSCTPIPSRVGRLPPVSRTSGFTAWLEVARYMVADWYRCCHVRASLEAVNHRRGWWLGCLVGPLRGSVPLRAKVSSFLII
jgi:hypothetical protein